MINMSEDDFERVLTASIPPPRRVQPLPPMPPRQLPACISNACEQGRLPCPTPSECVAVLPDFSIPREGNFDRWEEDLERSLDKLEKLLSWPAAGRLWLAAVCIAWGLICLAAGLLIHLFNH